MYEHILRAADAHGCNALPNAPMSKYTTFRVGGPVELLVEPNSEAALADLLTACREDGVQPLVIGKGSNLLVPDEGLPGVVLHMGDAFSAITMTGENTVRAEAGATVIKLCRFALERSLSGLEFAYGIPGTVGGAVYMNAGAYGGETADTLVSVRHMDRDGKIGTWTAEEAGLAYRHSNYMKTDYIILSVEFQLANDDPDAIRERMEDYMERRRSKQPLEYGSAGSTFKRPEGYFAGALIEQSGLKGVSVGGAQVSEKHAGFVINRDHATASDILELMALVRKTVQEQHGVTLEPEVRILGGTPWNS